MNQQIQKFVRKQLSLILIRLSEAALSWVNDVELFLDTPLPEHNDRTPRELASESYQRFNQAQAILSKIREAEQGQTSVEP